MIAPLQDALVTAVADLRAAERPLLAETTTQIAAAVASWAALPQAQHERPVSHAHPHKR